MRSMLVTCPETSHLELIEYEDDPLGMLIDACSRFGEPCALVCPRTCAARMDTRARIHEAENALSVGDDTSLDIPLPPTLPRPPRP